MKPFSEACEENKQPILAVLRRLFADVRQVLEVGSGTGQHAVYFARALTHLYWQTSDRSENHPGIRAWLEEYALPNVGFPLALDVTGSWPQQSFDGVFSANTTHIMSWQQVQDFFQGVGRVLCDDGCFALYGPFNFGGNYTSDSNRRFDLWLRQRDPNSGIRHFEDLNELAAAQGLRFQEDIEMPVNNRILVWRKHNGLIANAVAGDGASLPLR
jgi:cyclopropane fatty-acyl-phospholipid synthase-like methyltransferase